MSFSTKVQSYHTDENDSAIKQLVKKSLSFSKIRPVTPYSNRGMLQYAHLIIMLLSFRTDRSGQTVKEQSDQGH